MTKAWWIALLAVCISQSAYADLLRCDVSKKHWCTSTGCKSGDAVGEFNLFNTGNNTYSLCTKGKSDCQILEVREAKASGVFLILKFGGASYAKIAMQDVPLREISLGQFLEVRDSMLGAMASFGTCKWLQ